MQILTARFAPVLVTVLCLVLLLTACGGKTATQTGPGTTPSQILQLPAPSSLPRGVSYADAERYLDGSMFQAALPNHGVAAEGASLRFSSNWDPASSAYELAYATYSWLLAGYSDTQQVGVTWGAAPVAGEQVWIAVADWSTNRWVWQQLSTGGTLAGFGNVGTFAKADGTIDAVVVVLAPAASAKPLLNTVYVGPTTQVQPGDMQFTVDMSGGGTPISPLVYGTNDVSGAPAQAARPALVRFGGNRYTAYNWENNASNAGNDYFNENDDYFGADDTPGAAVQSEVQSSYDAGAQAVLVTVPIQGYVAADKAGGDNHGSGDVQNSGANYLDTRFKVDKPVKGAPFSNPPDPNDGFVYQDEFINWLNTTYPGDLAAGKLLVSLDNEPDLWHDTHPRIELNPVTYAELLQKNTDYAAAVKSVVPQAQCFGAVNFGFSGYINLQSAPDAAGNGEWLDYYLNGMKAAEGTHGNQRLLDVLDVHFYTEAEAGITHTAQYAGSDDLAPPEVITARLQAPRSLWDDTYVENSWITRDYNGLTPIKLIPWLKEKIANDYPGTKVAITEYNYGASADISGGIAEADALGIFGREGLFAATYFALNSTGDPYVYGAMQLYRNYDGAGGQYGDLALPVTWSDRAGYSAYASTYSAANGRAALLLINKQTASKLAKITLTGGPSASGTAKVYTLTAAGAQPQPAADIPLNGALSFNATLPAMSATLIVFNTLV